MLVPFLAAVFGSPYDSDVAAWVAAVKAAGGNASNAQRRRVTTLVKGLKADGVWPLLDRLWLFAAENSTQARRDLVARIAAAPTNAPTFTANRGYTGDGLSSFINTGFAPSVNGVKYTQDSASLFAYVRTQAAAGSDIVLGVSDVTPKAMIQPRAAGDLASVRVNDVGGTVASADSSGFWLGNRSASNARQVYRNGASILSDAPVSNGLPTHEMYALAQDNDGSENSFSTRQVAAIGFGGSHSVAQAAASYARMQTYMTAIGAQV